MVGQAREKFFRDKENALKKMRDVKFTAGEINKAISDENFVTALGQIKTIRFQIKEVEKYLEGK